MRKVVIDIDLSREGVREGVRQLRAFKSWLQEKTDLLLELLTNAGLQVAQMRFSAVAVIYDTGERPMNYNIEVDHRGHTWVIRALGEDICFLEFGAGVTWGKGYLGERPSKVVGIGEYGKGHGDNPHGWWFKNGNKAKRTLGNPPANAMYGAQEIIRQRVYDVAREVFG